MDLIPATPPSDRSWPRRLLNRLEVDRAVFYAIAARGWQFFAGPVTIVLIAKYFSPPVQGYYYTFWSLIALQMFFDLSFYVVIVNVASHEWQKLRLDCDKRIIGDPAALSRLVSLGRLTVLWYTVAGLLFAGGVGVGGLAFFAAAKEQAPGWQSPWLVLVALSGVVLATTPLLGILEGCNQVVAVYRLQFAARCWEIWWFGPAFRWVPSCGRLWRRPWYDYCVMRIYSPCPTGASLPPFSANPPGPR